MQMVIDISFILWLIIKWDKAIEKVTLIQF